MKSFHKILKITAGVFLLVAIAVSCIPEQESMGNAGQTLVKLLPDGFKLMPFDAATTPQSGVLFEVRRDVHSQAALNSATTVTLKMDNTLLDAFNEENDTELEPLPTSLATTAPAAAADGTVILEFGPGDFQKGLVVNVPNASQFDFSKAYALAYKIVSVSGTGTLSEAVGKEVIVQVGVKNKYDGKYEVTEVSPMVDFYAATLTGYYPFTYILETSGANSVLCLDATVWDNYMHPITSGGTAVSGYGSFGLELFFDPATDEIIEVRNPWGNPPANTRMPVLDPTGINAWDPETKNIDIKYWMIQPNTMPDPPHIRTTFDEKWTYKGPR
jgi:hypothetical protein